MYVFVVAFSGGSRDYAVESTVLDLKICLNWLEILRWHGQLGRFPPNLRVSLEPFWNSGRHLETTSLDHFVQKILLTKVRPSVLRSTYKGLGTYVAPLTQCSCHALRARSCTRFARFLSTVRALARPRHRIVFSHCNQPDRASE